MNEVIESMKIVKMYAWEKPFLERITNIRSQELKQLSVQYFLTSFTSSLTPCIPIFAFSSTFLTMMFLSVDINTVIVMTIFSLFTNLQDAVNSFPMSLKLLAEARIAINRLEEILDLAECSEGNLNSDGDTASINLVDASFRWGHDHQPTLSNINLSLQDNSLVGVAGTIGSGKSSLIAALLGEMEVNRGSRCVDGSVALVSQENWIFDGTLRDNITLGSAYDEDWFKHVVNVCALKKDLEMLENGDMTMIGDQGVSLSGGQEQRISIARAVYSRAKIYLLDDCLSAVDAKVSTHIFRRCIRETLKDKIVIFCSHNVQLLQHCDQVIVVDEGKIVEQGAPADLMNNPDGVLTTMSMSGVDYPKLEDPRVLTIKSITPKHNRSSRRGSSVRRLKSRISVREHPTEERMEMKRLRSLVSVISSVEEDSERANSSIKRTGKSVVWSFLRYLRCSGNPVLMIIIYTVLTLFMVIRLGIPPYINEITETSDDDIWKLQLGFVSLNLGMFLFGVFKVKFTIFVRNKNSFFRALV